MTALIEEAQTTLPEIEDEDTADAFIIAATQAIEHHEIADIWKNKRVRVFGTIYYKALGQIFQVESDAVQFLRPREELPRPGEIVDEDFTGGLRSEEYLERLRNGNLS